MICRLTKDLLSVLIPWCLGTTLGYRYRMSTTAMILIQEILGNGSRLLWKTGRWRRTCRILEAESEWVRLMLLDMWASGGRPTWLIRAECNFAYLPRCLLNYFGFFFVLQDLLLKLLEQLMLWLYFLHRFMWKDGYLQHLRLVFCSLGTLVV